MRKGLKPIFFTNILAVVALTISSLWMLIGTLTFIAWLCGWQNYEFATSISTHVLTSILVSIISGSFITYTRITHKTKQKEQVICSLQP